MKANWWYRFLLFVFLTVLSAVTVMPTIFKFDENSKFPIKSKISLGLDLQGGLYMILGIDFKKVYKDEITGYARKMAFSLNDFGVKAKMGELKVTDPDDPQFSVVIENAADLEKAKQRIKDYFPSIIRMTEEKGTELFYGLTKVIRTQVEEQSVTKSIEVIRNRIDEFGVTEPEILAQGKDRIVVALPGVKDIERAKELIGKTAKLEFRIVNDEVPPAKIQEWLEKVKASGLEFKKGESWSKYVVAVNEKLKADLPKDFELAFERKVNKTTNEVTLLVPMLVDAVPRLTGDELQDAGVQIDQQKNEPYVSLEFKSLGAKLFEEITGGNVGKRMAVMLDGNIYTAPNIQTKIGGGRAQITLGSGNFNSLMQQARDIALVLRAGALPVQLDFQEQRSVGPSLGQDSIAKTSLAALISCAAVFIFMMFYYRLSGVIAVVTLLANVLFILAGLVGLEATLTLPGIAGIALTVGMAVDGNIIIYERIREEIKKGIGYYKAVENGFNHAFWTILDANVTTAFAGICLLQFGTGPVRGFAVTLLLGIVATVYTAYFLNNILFEFYMNKTEGQDLSI
ncbi:MAG: protein-export membrane protein SecD [Bdellovibrionales bacterium GWA2_49_15]|nr:MAG: protein-export membrane protein SecD [Bdellovibrionales bacterium GWA2_49_15]HAZ14515.1 protein translocase subunit SecD [Bdellovibrionales bacterium]